MFFSGQVPGRGSGRSTVGAARISTLEFQGSNMHFSLSVQHHPVRSAVETADPPGIPSPQTEISVAASDVEGEFSGYEPLRVSRGRSRSPRQSTRRGRCGVQAGCIRSPQAAPQAALPCMSLSMATSRPFFAADAYMRLRLRRPQFNLPCARHVWLVVMQIRSAPRVGARRPPARVASVASATSMRIPVETVGCVEGRVWSITSGSVARRMEASKR